MRLCPATAIGEGRARGFPEQGLFLTRVGGELRAWRDACPHVAGAPLAWRRDAYLDAAGREIVCAAHGARFDPHTGRCTAGPALGLALTPVAITLDAQGHVSMAAPE